MSDDQLVAAREAVARVRRERDIAPDHDCGAADDGPDRSHTDPADRLGPRCP
jgi:hypothetical protein